MAAVESTIELSAQELARAVDALVDECRVESLWSYRPDYYPRTDPERLQVLEAIQERSDLERFRRAGRLKAWLAPSREGPSFVQAQVGDGAETEVLQWVQDSAYRFFPLVESELFGLTLHPFDHATNKVLALAGRRKVRDWVDTIQCHDTLQPLGYLAWAASGKDPGLSPLFIIEQAARTRYVQGELDQLQFDGPTPRAAELSVRWHQAIDEARQLIRLLPSEQVGRCVLDHAGRLATAPPATLVGELAAGRLAFHEGRIRGAFPELRIGLPPAP